jgi:hypothetical protein
VREKTKVNHIDSATAAGQQTRRQQPGAQDAGKEADAIKESGNVDPGKLKENRDRLGVDSDHKTPDMKKGDRGTFP